MYSVLCLDARQSASVSLHIDPFNHSVKQMVLRSFRYCSKVSYLPRARDTRRYLAAPSWNKRTRELGMTSSEVTGLLSNMRMKSLLWKSCPFAF